MYKLFSKIVFFIKGWKIEGGLPPGVKKCVLIAAPHTSNWDFLYGSCAWCLFGFKIKYLAKKELFKFPAGLFLRALGGIPVDRSRHNNLVDAMVELVNSKEELVVLMTPEGTRKKVTHWKTGFYHLAQKANVPIVLGKVNYAKKTAIVGKALIPSGDINKDFDIIREFYKDAVGRIPENFSLSAIQPAVRERE